MTDFDPEFDKLPEQPPTIIGGDKSAAAWHPNTAPEVPHADLIDWRRLDGWVSVDDWPTFVKDVRAALGDTVPREQMTVDKFREAVGVERASHAARGYDTAHDREHGVPHLLRWAIDYASRGEAVKSGALIVAALSLSESLEREERGVRALHDAEVKAQALDDFSKTLISHGLDLAAAGFAAASADAIREEAGQ